MDSILRVDSLACLYDDIDRVRILTDETGYFIVRGAVDEEAAVGALRARVCGRMNFTTIVKLIPEP